MTVSNARWRSVGSDAQLWVEVFAVLNFGGLVVDIVLAHSSNQFRRQSEYVPLVFSAVAAVVLAAVVVHRRRLPALWRDVGHLIGWLAIAVGLAGVILHLDSAFFYDRTIKSLTYAAPFAAPLAYTGLGLLLIANRLVAPYTLEWAHWVLLLTLGGFVGNFVFSLTDHAQNGFFNPIEWVPVVASAAAIGFLVVPFLVRTTPAYLKLCAAVLVGEAVVGLAGFALHLVADFGQTGGSLFDRVIAGAPPLAPLLFTNLAALGLIALWVMAHPE